MAIKIKREQLERIVREELTRYLAIQLNEAAPGRGTILDDEPEDELPPEDIVPNPGDAPEEKLPPVDPGAETGDDPGEVPELPASEDDSDIDLDALEAGEEPPSEEEEGTVAGELTGKSIDSVIVDEDSKIMPGATEIVFTFKENPDAFRLLVTKTGKIKYFYRGLHNTLDSSVAPMPQDDAPEDTDDMSGMVPGALGDEGDDEDIEDMPPLGQEDMPPEEKEKEEEIP